MYNKIIAIRLSPSRPAGAPAMVSLAKVLLGDLTSQTQPSQGLFAFLTITTAIIPGVARGIYSARGGNRRLLHHSLTTPEPECAET